MKSMHPEFAFQKDGRYLADQHGNPEVLTTRFDAEAKINDLQKQGYKVELIPGDVFYKIKLVEPATII